VSIFANLKDRMKAVFQPRSDILASQDAESTPGSRDALFAIEELSRAVRNDPDAVEIYLALGNLYRLRGDIDRAVQIRSSLIVRPGLDNRFRARAYLELGRDYRRGGFVDRALQAFDEAQRLGAERDAIILELAHLHADSGSFDLAAEQFGRVGHKPAQAHYLVRHAEDLCGQGEFAEAVKTLTRAVKVYPGSIEAWTTRIAMHIRSGEWRKAKSMLREAMQSVSPDRRFLVFDGILAITPPENAPDSVQQFEQNRCECVLPVISEQEPELLLHYYGALFLLRCGEREQAGNWLAKAMVLRPDFWAARLELLGISMDRQQLSPVFKGQLEYFVSQARHVKRFVCQNCGLRREQAFYLCPRCRSWHSATFRLSLQD